MHLTVGQDWQGKIGTKLAVDAGQEIHLKAGMTIVIEGGMTISLKAGGSFINIGPDGVTIQGAIVNCTVEVAVPLTSSARTMHAPAVFPYSTKSPLVIVVSALPLPV